MISPPSSPVCDRVPVFAFPFPNGSSAVLLRMRLNISRQASTYNGLSISAVRKSSTKHVKMNVHAPGTRERVPDKEVASEMPNIALSSRTFAGQAFPLGVSEVESGINFAIFSQHATSVTLCLSLPQREKPVGLDDGMLELPLDPNINRTGDIWHICIKDLPRSNVLYGYRIDGPCEWHQGHRFDKKILLLDPYAKLVEGRRYFGDVSQKFTKSLGIYNFDSLPFDWGDNYKLPNIPEKDLVIYEMNVRAFTADKSSGLDPSIRGSYLGVIEKIPRLLELGVNAVELLLVFEFDELEFQRRQTPKITCNGGEPLTASHEFKEMFKALHNAGIEAILDVVYNHTNEADDKNPYTTSFHGIDNKVYYLIDINNKGQLIDLSGSGNTLNCNHPVVMELILDSLRHWVTEYHVDGFRFDLASVLCRGTDGSAFNSPPLIRAIAKDSVLSRCKIIAEPWDCGDLYLVGKFPNRDRWAEWNGKYRDDMRRFIRVLCGKVDYLDGVICAPEFKDSLTNVKSRLHDNDGGDIFLAFNAHDYFVEVSIPLPPPNGRWLRVVDTNLESPDDIFPKGVPGIGNTYNMAPFSSILLEAKRV